jgi:hypothetical protein
MPESAVVYYICVCFVLNHHDLCGTFVHNPYLTLPLQPCLGFLKPLTPLASIPSIDETVLVLHARKACSPKKKRKKKKKKSAPLSLTDMWFTSLLFLCFFLSFLKKLTVALSAQPSTSTINNTIKISFALSIYITCQRRSVCVCLIMVVCPCCMPRSTYLSMNHLLFATIEEEKRYGRSCRHKSNAYYYFFYGSPSRDFTQAHSFLTITKK